MRIELENLEDGKGSFAHVYQPEELDLADERVALAQSVVIDGEITTSGSEVRVSGRLNTKVDVECDRCLKTLQVPVSAKFALQYITAQQYQAIQAAELTAEQMALSVFDGEAIDVDEIVKEQILLAVPDRALCREDCMGICSNCGKDLNEGPCDCESTYVDPRWAALKELKSDQS